MEEPEEWWHILEAANKYLNTRLVEQVDTNLHLSNIKHSTHIINYLYVDAHINYLSIFQLKALVWPFWNEHLF